MPKVIIASKNPVKIQATQAAFEAMFPEQDWLCEGVSVPSGVPDQPMSDEETRRGAQNRAAAAREARPEADYWTGIEGGIRAEGESMEAFAWMVVHSRRMTGRARTATFQLPPEVARLVRAGHELGQADDIVFGRSNSKQKDGAVGILTDGLIDRSQYYAHAIKLALVPFKKSALYDPS
jgi:inosine/xanthosine triphosphatase